MKYLTRRHFLALLPPFAGALFLAACGGGNDNEPSTAGNGATGSSTPAGEPTAAAGNTGVQIAATPSCVDADDATMAETEGPYFTPNSPERASLLESGVTGTKLVIEGFVVSTRCAPILRALVDFWQADDAGAYDNVGYKLRGHQFTDANGRYRLETIVPALYPGRTRHIHVKVQQPGGRVLTTQLFFPTDAAANRQDGIYDDSLLLSDYKDASGGKAGSFTFVLSA